jgi:hypothetical protein
MKGGRAVVVVDGKEEGPAACENIYGLTFSPDSKRAAYVAQSGGRWLVVCGEAKSPGFDMIGMAPLFTPDSGHVICGGWREKEKRWVLVVDGAESAKHAFTAIPGWWGMSEEWLGQLKDGGKMRYVAVDEDGAWVMEVEWPKEVGAKQ